MKRAALLDRFIEDLRVNAITMRTMRYLSVLSGRSGILTADEGAQAAPPYY
jgi:hypothetical protein